MTQDDTPPARPPASRHDRPFDDDRGYSGQEYDVAKERRLAGDAAPDHAASDPVTGEVRGSGAGAGGGNPGEDPDEDSAGGSGPVVTGAGSGKGND